MELEKLVELAAEGINVGYKVANKGGVFAIFSLSDEVAALSTLDKAKAIEELKAALKDEAKGRALVAVFKGKLDLANDVLEKKIEDGAEVVIVDGVHIAFEVSAVVASAKSIVEKVKSILS